VLAWFGATSGLAQQRDPEDTAFADALDVVQPIAESCGECHRAELAVWERTDHARGYNALHRDPRAIAIAEAMDLPLIRRNSLCLDCHYTAVVASDETQELRAAHGVSCQSCHGAARSWIDTHNDYGVTERDFQRARALETPAHAAQRNAAAAANGMRQPHDLYAMATPCYQCHIVAVADLVNQTPHSAGTFNFELVNWSQGRLRHNFLESYLTGDGTENEQGTPEKMRLMYVTGRALALEYSLRALARSTRYDNYFNLHRMRIDEAVRHAEVIAASAPAREVEEMLSAIGRIQLKPANTEPLLQAAEEIAAAIRRFLSSHDGSRLAGLDPMIAAGSEFVPLSSR
jgi:hypothetical protein